MTAQDLTTAEIIMSEIINDPIIMQNIESGMTPKEACFDAFRASYSLWKKLEDKELDRVVMEVIFNDISKQVLAA